MTIPKRIRRSLETVLLIGQISLLATLFVPVNSGTALAVCVTPPTNMVAWYPGNDNTKDITTYANTGTFNGTTAYAAGEVANGFSLNGASYVSAPSAAQNNFGTGDFSIDAWIQTSSNANQTIVDKRAYDTVNGVWLPGYLFFTSGGYLGAQLLAGGSWTNFIASTGPVADGILHHVALTVIRNSATGGNLYVDGVSVLTFNPTAYSGSSLDNTNELRIGRTLTDEPSGVTAYFTGIIDEAELFSRALSAVEVSAIFSAGADGKCVTTRAPVPALGNSALLACALLVLVVGARALHARARRQTE